MVSSSAKLCVSLVAGGGILQSISSLDSSTLRNAYHCGTDGLSASDGEGGLKGAVLGILMMAICYGIDLRVGLRNGIWHGV